MYFQYGEEEVAYLKARDRRLAAVIDRLGPIEREVDAGLFSSIVRHIIGQQVSAKAQAAVWNRMREALGDVTAETVSAAGREALRSFGMSYRKADCIGDFAARVTGGGFDLESLRGMTDADAVSKLVTLRGVGVWTAEMILLFCLQRPDILSFGDLGIQRGMRMVYRRRVIAKDFFERRRRRLSPYGSTASLYFWAVSGGALPDLADPARPAAAGK